MGSTQILNGKTVVISKISQFFRIKLLYVYGCKGKRSWNYEKDTLCPIIVTKCPFKNNGHLLRGVYCN